MKWLVAVLFCLLANLASADVVEVRSGDHPTFTRMVLAIPPGQSWQVGKTASGYVIDTGNPDDTFDLTAAFERIQRDRVASLEPGGSGRLEFVLGCQCHAEAFQWLPDRVVVDIIDGPAPAESPFETALADLALPSQAETGDVATGAEIARQAEAQSSMLDSFAMGPDPAAPPPVLAEMGTTAAPDLLPLLLTPPAGIMLPLHQDPDVVVALEGTAVSAGEDPSASASALAETQQAIIESLGRAASQGLLDVSVAPEDPAQHADDAHLADDAHALPTLEELAHASQPSTLDAFAIAGPDSNQPGLTSHTSVDGLQPQTGTTGHVTPQGGRCLDEGLLSTETWGDDRDFGTQIAERLRALTTEFDEYPDGAIESLARTYVFFGFGREALQTLALDDRDSLDRRILVALAHLVDEEPEPSGLLAGQLGCATEAALWTALSREDLTGTTESERTAVIAGFRALPPMLRGHLGARLARIFLDFGDADMADEILETAKGHTTADRPETDLTAAEIALETEGPEAAIDALGTLAEEDLRLTPEGLAQLLDLALTEGHQIDPDLLSLAETMVYENRGAPIAATLIALQARALTAADAFDAAFALLAGDVAPMDQETLVGLQAQAAVALTERAPDPEFLDFAFNATLPVQNPGVENAVAGRLTELGFADQAERLLQSTATGAEARDRRYLQAEIALQLDRPAEVEGILGGMSDPRAAELLARALAAQGEYAAATAAVQTLPGVVPDAGQAWRAGEWALLEASDDPLLRATSGAVLSEGEPADPDAPLTAGRALLEESSATRSLATDLLERFAVDPATPAAPATN